MQSDDNPFLKLVKKTLTLIIIMVSITAKIRNSYIIEDKLKK